jgi:hypothetical protein
MVFTFLKILRIGSAQLHLELFHDATDTLQKVNKSLSSNSDRKQMETVKLQQMTRSLLKAVKRKLKSRLLEQRKEAEAKLGPVPPPDLSVKRHQQNESYVDFMKRQKIQEAAANTISITNLSTDTLDAGQPVSAVPRPTSATNPSITPGAHILEPTGAPVVSVVSGIHEARSRDSELKNQNIENKGISVKLIMCIAEFVLSQYFFVTSLTSGICINF